VPVEWEPPVEDDSGYRIRRGDLAFLGLGDAEVRGCLSRAHPLGMTGSLYRAFSTGLWEALDADGVHDADVRLKGSSVNFYSGPHKRMPYHLRDIYAEFRAKYGRKPRLEEIEWILNELDEQWPGDPRPLRRPFNALYRLKIHRSPSDYDLQICSDEMHRRAVTEVLALGLTPEDARVIDPVYSFLDKKLMLTVSPAVEQWRLTASQFFRYDVTVAAFPACGPPNLSDDPDLASLSNHLRDTDWTVPRHLPSMVAGQ
jgi:hypothetical protein